MPEKTTDAPSSQGSSFLRRHRIAFMLSFPAAVVIVGVYLWLTGGRYVSTDDAYIRTGRVQISSNVGGRVVELAVRENQRVRQGDLLFRLDPATPDAVLAEAEAELRSAEAQSRGSQASYRQELARLATAQSNLDYRRREAVRDQGLVDSGVVSREDADKTRHEVELAARELAAAQQAVGVAAAQMGAPPEAEASANPQVQRARAALERARLARNDTVVRAPQDGVVTRVSNLQVGSYVNAAQAVFSLINDEVWIEANFKEGDLANMRPGQAATIRVDAHPDLKLTARVDSLSPGTGSSFALLPPENATGNWVKVVQRVPVRLTFTKRPSVALQAGLSSVVRVDTKSGGQSR